MHGRTSDKCLLNEASFRKNGIALPRQDGQKSPVMFYQNSEGVCTLRSRVSQSGKISMRMETLR